MAYDFHYTPTGTGVISGKEVLEQTEDAINDLGNTAISGVQEALDKAEQALTNSANAVDDAQTALNTANNAEGVAIQAQTDVGNLSGTVTNIGNRVTTAEGNITNLQGRMTTAEGNITNLQGRMTTAETNIGNLQTAVSTAQATANSAQQTATTARQQSYVFRYSGTAVVPNSTIAYSTIDNTDNIKSGDKVFDVDGKIFTVVSVDTANQTVTVGSALIDLALDANVVHTSGNETVGGEKTFTSPIKGYNSDSTQSTVSIDLRTSKVSRGNTSDGVDTFGFGFRDKNNNTLASISCVKRSTGGISEYHTVNTTDSSNNVLSESYSFNLNKDGNSTFRPETNDKTLLGTSTNNWKGVYATNYYYGSNNVEFSTKFVTTDTAQTITETKTFTNTIKSQKEIEFTGNRLAYILSEFSASYSGLSLCTYSSSGAVKIGTWKVDDNDNTKHVLDTSLGYLNVTTGSVNSVNCTYLTPRNSTDSKLGDSTNKWKEINGLTPSSLSMPTDNMANIIDISGYLTVLDGSSANTYQAPDNGYISITMNNCSGIQAYITGFWGNQIVRPSSGGVRFFMPICKNMTANILIFGGTVDNARFIPCQGNI